MRENDSRFNLRHEVLKTVAENEFNDTLNAETIDSIPFQIIPGDTAKFRCCVYKEREIIRQRVRLAMGHLPIPVYNVENIEMKKHIVQVIPAACEGCPINRFQVTENCQNCLQQACK